MPSETIRLLLLADTHLGFDLPFRPRVKRRRRGHDFFANFERALGPALRGEVDLVVHGGDLFYRSRVPNALVEMAMAPLVRVAESGVPVYLVPGNHERSRIPLHLWGFHENLHIFDRPKTFIFSTRGTSVALAGFPFSRRARDDFKSLVRETGAHQVSADIHLLCLHQTVEGAQVGAQNYTFRSGADVIPGVDVPESFAAILSGHIHRGQILTQDLRGNPLGAPVIYPGSIERTSFAERTEQKSYVIIELTPKPQAGENLGDASFVPLPARPMHTLSVNAKELEAVELPELLRTKLSELDPESIVRVQVPGEDHAAAIKQIPSARLRSLAPPSMNVYWMTNRTRKPTS